MAAQDRRSPLSSTFPFPLQRAAPAAPGVLLCPGLKARLITPDTQARWPGKLQAVAAPHVQACVLAKGRVI